MVIIFEHGRYISALAHVRMLILSIMFFYIVKTQFINMVTLG